jgi:hypothetical protein
MLALAATTRYLLPSFLSAVSTRVNKLNYALTSLVVIGKHPLVANEDINAVWVEFEKKRLIEISWPAIQTDLQSGITSWA